jgi:hypothetical protein
VKTWSGGNGLWKVVPPSRLNEHVSMFVASSSAIRSTIWPVTDPGLIDTAFDWTTVKPAPKPCVSDCEIEYPGGVPCSAATAADKLFTERPAASMIGAIA